MTAEASYPAGAKSTDAHSGAETHRQSSNGQSASHRHSDAVFERVDQDASHAAIRPTGNRPADAECYPIAHDMAQHGLMLIDHDAGQSQFQPPGQSENPLAGFAAPALPFSEHLAHFNTAEGSNPNPFVGSV
jgi:hypothetical protein